MQQHNDPAQKTLPPVRLLSARKKAAILLFLLAPLLFAATLTSSVAAPTSRSDEFFQALKPGNFVTAVERYGFLEIRVIDDGTIGASKIIAVRDDHIVTQSLGSVERAWIPRSAIQRVVWTKTTREGWK